MLHVGARATEVVQCFSSFLRCERYDQPTDGAKARRDGGTCKVDYRHAEHAAVRLGASSNLRVAHGAHVRACTCWSPPVYSRAIASPRLLRSFSRVCRVHAWVCLRVLTRFCARTFGGRHVVSFGPLHALIAQTRSNSLAQAKRKQGVQHNMLRRRCSPTLRAACALRHARTGISHSVH